MSPPVRRLLIVALALVAAVGLFAFVALPRLVDPERHRGRSERLASDALGRPVGFEAVQVSWWPLGLRVDGISVGALPGEPPGDALRAASLRVGARVTPLLRGTLEITSLTVDRPLVRVVRGDDGTWLLPLPPAGDDGPGDATATDGGASVAVDAMEIRDGTIEIVDDRGGTLRTVERLDAMVGGLGGGGPVTFEARARAAVDAALTVDLVVEGELRDPPEPGSGAARLEAIVELSGPRDQDRGRARVRMFDGDGGRLELDIEPSTLSGATLARLVPALVDPPPVTIIDAGTTELSGRLVVPFGEGRASRTELRASVRELTADAGLGVPLEAVAAEIELVDDRATLTGFSARIGASDVAGSVEVALGEVPELTVDLTSQRLDLNELLSGLAAAEPATAPSGGAVTPADDALPHVRGRLRIASGSLDTVDFTDATTTIDVRDSSVRLDPLRMRIYDGGFAGSVRVDLAQDPPGIVLTGTTDGIDLGALTADAFGMPDVLAGRLDAQIDSRMAGLDMAQLLATAVGEATVRVGDGVLRTLDLIDRLSGVSGVFGERSRAALAAQLGEGGTTFGTALGRVELDRGTMHLRELSLESPAFELGGSATVDMLRATLDGRFVLRLPPEVSAAMRADGSKAAEVFWNSRAGRVEVPFTLTGPFARPIPGIDFTTAARTAIRERAEDELRSLLERRLGDDAAKTEAPVAEPPAAEPEAEPDPATLGARIVSHRWRGSILARDLELDGVVHGPAMARARVIVRDARGTEVRERGIVELDRYRDEAGDPAAGAVVAWRVKIDGERLLLAKMPLTVVVEVTDADGATAKAERVVNR